jgi:hypothetical protein
VAHVHPRSPDPCSPSPGPQPEHTNTGLRPAAGHGDPRWHRFTRVGIRWRAHTAHIIEDHVRLPRSPGWAPPPTGDSGQVAISRAVLVVVVAAGPSGRERRHRRRARTAGRSRVVRQRVTRARLAHGVMRSSMP